MKARAVGIKLTVPLAGSFVVFRVTEKTETIRFSLRTDAPSLIKSRNAEAAAYLESVWRGLREDVAVSLGPKQAHALGGFLYHAWADSEDREITVSGTIGFDGTWTPEPPPLPHDMAAAWENLREKLDALPADDAEALEAVLGSIVDRLLLTHGIRKVDAHSRLILLGAFSAALHSSFSA